MAYQAIMTKSLGPTDTKGMRVKALCEAGSLTVNWDHKLNIETNHRKAAEALCAKLGWTTQGYERLHQGGLPGGAQWTYAFVFADDEGAVRRVR